MYRKALLTLLLLLASMSAAAQTNWELRIMASADLQEIHTAYMAGEFSRAQLRAFVDAEYQRMARHCPNGVGTCDTLQREQRNVQLFDLYVAAYSSVP